MCLMVARTSGKTIRKGTTALSIFYTKTLRGCLVMPIASCTPTLPSTPICWLGGNQVHSTQVHPNQTSSSLMKQPQRYILLRYHACLMPFWKKIMTINSASTCPCVRQYNKLNMTPKFWCSWEAPWVVFTTGLCRDCNCSDMIGKVRSRRRNTSV